MTPWFGDTSFFIALLSADDTSHDLALLRARELAGRRLITSTWVLVELANACSPPLRRKGFHDTMEFLRSHAGATIIEPRLIDYEKGVKLYMERMDKSWSLTDCISFVLMAEGGLNEALTADHHFEQAGYSALLIRRR